MQMRKIATTMRLVRLIGRRDFYFVFPGGQTLRLDAGRATQFPATLVGAFGNFTVCKGVVQMAVGQRNWFPICTPRLLQVLPSRHQEAVGPQTKWTSLKVPGQMPPIFVVAQKQNGSHCADRRGRWKEEFS